MSRILIIAKPDILSMNGAVTLINFCSLGFIMTHSFGKMGRDLFRNLKQQSHEFIAPNLNTLHLCTYIINGIMNNTLTKCPMST